MYGPIIPEREVISKISDNALITWLMAIYKLRFLLLIGCVGNSVFGFHRCPPVNKVWLKMEDWEGFIQTMVMVK